jgi:beta-lactamase regulating signal transducer with metallopeptidase domain
MNPAWMSPLADHLWQSTVFAAFAALLTLALGHKRARVRHGLWLAASCKFLVPFSLLIVLGGRVGWRAPQAAPTGVVVAMEAISEPFSLPVAAPRPPEPHQTNPFPAVLLAVWACGVVGISINWWRRWRRIAATVRAGTPVDLHLPIRAVASPTLVEPGVFGIIRPTLVLPAGIFDRLTPKQLDAVIAHEFCHVRYRDNLVASLHMLVETVFWFHPLVWWIGKRMVE